MVHTVLHDYVVNDYMVCGIWHTYSPFNHAFLESLRANSAKCSHAPNAAQRLTPKAIVSLPCADVLTEAMVATPYGKRSSPSSPSIRIPGNSCRIRLKGVLTMAHVAHMSQKTFGSLAENEASLMPGKACQPEGPVAGLTT